MATPSAMVVLSPLRQIASWHAAVIMLSSVELVTGSTSSGAAQLLHQDHHSKSLWAIGFLWGAIRKSFPLLLLRVTLIGSHCSDNTNNDGRTLENGMGLSVPNTIEACTTACFNAGYPYAGTEYSGECCKYRFFLYCGDYSS